MKCYKYIIPTISSSSTSSPIYFDKVNCEKTPFFKGEVLILFSLREVAIGGCYALISFFVLFLKFLMLLGWSRSRSMVERERNEKIFMVLVHAWWYRSSMLVLFCVMHAYFCFCERKRRYIYREIISYSQGILTPMCISLD